MKKIDHKLGLLKLYNSILQDDLIPFQRLLFERGIFLLNAGHDPKKVERWVSRMEKNWMNAPKYFHNILF